MRVTVSGPVTHRCPFVDERDLGTFYASWAGDAIELHALASHLTTYAELSVTHEAMTAAIVAWLIAAGGIDVDVVTSWQTAGLSVEVAASP